MVTVRVETKEAAPVSGKPWTRHYDPDVPGSLVYPRVPLQAILDDAAENRMLVSALLIQQGFAVDQAADGEAAVAAAERNPLDLIVLDSAKVTVSGIAWTPWSGIGPSSGEITMTGSPRCWRRWGAWRPTHGLTA